VGWDPSKVDGMQVRWVEVVRWGGGAGEGRHWGGGWEVGEADGGSEAGKRADMERQLGWVGRGQRMQVR